MTIIIRLLIISASFLILPTCATPPATTPRHVARTYGTATHKTVLIKKYLVLQRFGEGRESKTRLRIYDITLIVVLNEDSSLRPQPPEVPLEEFSTRIRRARRAEAPENVYGTPNCCPVLPML
jgi:hypothetical protein